MELPIWMHVDIDGGAMDGTAIGANTASTGAFTNVTASGTLSVTGATTLGNLSGTGSISGFDANLNAIQYQVIIITWSHR